VDRVQGTVSLRAEELLQVEFMESDGLWERLMKAVTASNHLYTLKKLKGYLDGAEQAAQLAENWRVRYSRRRAMMEELRNAGF